jgi:hypothetical protein
MTDPKTIQAVNVLHNLVTSLTPTTQKGWEMAKNVVMTNSILTLTDGIIFTVLGMYILVKLWGKFLPQIVKKLEDSGEDPGTAYLLGLMVTTIVVIVTILGTVDLFNPWAWVGLFHPGLTLAHQAMHKVLGG